MRKKFKKKKKRNVQCKQSVAESAARVEEIPVEAETTATD